MGEYEDELGRALGDARLEEALGDPLHAAEIYDRMAIREKEAARGRPPFSIPDRSFVYELKAALCVAREGVFEPVERVLRRATEYDWLSLRYWWDPADVEQAFVHLLIQRAAAGDRAGFRAVLDRALDRFSEFRKAFLSYPEDQAKLLMAGSALGWDDECRMVLNRVNAGKLAAHPSLRLFATHLRLRLGMHAAPEPDSNPDEEGLAEP